MQTPWQPRSVVLAGVILTVAAGAGAQSAVPAVDYGNAKRIASVDGEDNFRQYCATCHGLDGRGTGPAAQALEVPPADLTLIAVRHGGTYSKAHVRETIAGNHDTPLVGMPNWASVLRSVCRSDAEFGLRLSNLVVYLESIQRQ